jgi:hypothetical protein
MNLVYLGGILDFFDTIGKILNALIDIGFTVGIGFIVANGIILAIKISKAQDPDTRTPMVQGIIRLGIGFLIVVATWIAYSFLLSGTIQSIGGGIL